MHISRNYILSRAIDRGRSIDTFRDSWMGKRRPLNWLFPRVYTWKWLDRINFTVQRKWKLGGSICSTIHNSSILCKFELNLLHSVLKKIFLKIYIYIERKRERTNNSNDIQSYTKFTFHSISWLINLISIQFHVVRISTN